jgi:hypothetical protein
MIDETLVAAAQYMDKHGKVCGRLRDEEGRVCILGALIAVVGEGYIFYLTAPDGIVHGKHIASEIRLEEYARAQGYRCVDIPYLSDVVFKTKEETVKFMMEAAEWEPQS